MKLAAVAAACALLAGGGVCPAQDQKAAPEAAKEQVARPILREELLRMLKVDQWYRQRAMREDETGLPTPEVLLEDMKIADERNAARVRTMVREVGWPGRSLVGTDGAQAAFLIVQHANLEIQKELLPHLQRAVKAGEAEGAHLAYLEDRVRVREGKKQIYGTQVGRGEGGTPEPLGGLEDEANVDARRKEVGLGPLAEYMAGFGGGARVVLDGAGGGAGGGGAPVVMDPKDLPPGTVIKLNDGQALPPGSKIKIVPLDGGAKPPEGAGGPIVIGPDGGVVGAAPEEIADPKLRDDLLARPTMKVVTGKDAPAGAPAGEPVMVAGPDGRLERIRAVVKERGWPGKSMVGERASAQAFRVVCRAPIDVVREVLPAVVAAASAGEAPKAHAAFLTDLVRVKSGEKQLYGTQVRRADDGTLELYPVEEPENLEHRRRGAGLPLSTEYLASLRPPR